MGDDDNLHEAPDEPQRVVRNADPRLQPSQHASGAQQPNELNEPQHTNCVHRSKPLASACV
eukprot:7389099-Prymnesium_polylepis.1